MNLIWNLIEPFESKKTHFFNKQKLLDIWRVVGQKLGLLAQQMMRSA
jgi:hypothetical protein